MKKPTLIFMSICMASLFMNCNKTEKSTADFSALTDSYFDAKNALNPMEATVFGQNQYNDQLQFEMTDSFRSKQKAFYDKYEAALAKIDEASLSPEEKNSYEIIKWETGMGKEMLQYPTNLMPLNQFWGTHLTIGQYAGGTSAQPFKTEKDYRNFLKRIELYGNWLDSAMVYMKKGIDQKIVLPKSLVVKAIPQFDNVVTEKAEDNLFYSAIKIMPNDFSDDVKKTLAADYAHVINTQLIPKLRNMSAFLKNDYLPASRATSGIGSLPFGKALYASYTKSYTTTEMTPEEIHELGLK
jgi:uncharacterized protein (DUF885 family)